MQATVSHSEQALAVARATGWDLDGEASERDWTAIGLGPVGQHRDSDALAKSNYRVVLADLSERFGDAIGEASFGHWGVGWVEEVIFDAGNVEAAEAVEAWRSALEDYPVACESDWSELEWEDAHPEGDSLCYSHDDDCGCGRERA